MFTTPEPKESTGFIVMIETGEYCREITQKDDGGVTRCLGSICLKVYDDVAQPEYRGRHYEVCRGANDDGKGTHFSRWRDDLPRLFFSNETRKVDTSAALPPIIGLADPASTPRRTSILEARYVLAIMRTRSADWKFRDILRAYFPSDIDVAGFLEFCTAHGALDIEKREVYAWVRLSQDERVLWIDKAIFEHHICDPSSCALRVDHPMHPQAEAGDLLETHRLLDGHVRAHLRFKLWRKAPFVW